MKFEYVEKFLPYIFWLVAIAFIIPPANYNAAIFWGISAVFWMLSLFNRDE